METIAAIASAIAAIAAAVIARDALVASRAVLFAQLLQEYAESQMGRDISTLMDFYRVDPKTTAARYEAAMRIESGNVAMVNEARRRVSHHFKKIAKLCDARLIDSRTVALVYGAQVFNGCIDVLAPIDDAHSRIATGKPDDPRWLNFYRAWYDEARRSGKG